MPIPKSFGHLSPRRMVSVHAALWFMLAAPASLHAADIVAGDVTSTLGPTFFVDDTSNGGTDTDINHNATASFVRLFNGLLAPNQGPTRVVITGFGFCTHTSATANDATSITVNFTYLGADQAVGGGDDVAIGSATGNFTFTAGTEYVFAFDAPLSADLNITGTRFRIQVTPFNANHTATPDVALKLKTGALVSEPAATSAKLSVAGVASPLISPGRINLAKFQPVTTSSVNGQRLASYVTDGVAGNDNRWQSTGSGPHWAEVDFPFPVEVGSAQVLTGVDDASAVSNFSIQYFDGSTWVTIPGTTVSGNADVERNLVFANPVTASSFRVYSTDGTVRIRELALYSPNGPSGYPLGTDFTVNLACGRPAVASANTSGNFALNAVDGRADAFMWQSTTAGTNTLDIDLRVSTKVGSAHLYSGSNGVSPLANFSLKYWDGTAWQNIPGGTVAGNTTANLVVPFSSPVTTSQIRLEFTNPGTASIRELQVFPANAGNTGYALGTNLIGSGAFASYETYNDSFYLITNPSSGRKMSVPANGQPALDPAGLTFGQSQYQVLLNHSTGTYRLRNRATGECLSGAQLSKTPGDLLTDAPYTALPHQDWILDPLGGGVFRLINQWSGLAIDTQGGSTAQGTPLVQNTANGSTTQRWEFSKYAGYPKKGIGGTSFAMAYDPAWAYNWGRLNPHQFPSDATFHPMQWGNFSWDIGSTQGPIWQNYPSWRTRADGIHLLGFNEPDRTDQSNMTLSQVISLWPRLQELDLPLVSPAPGTSSWLDSFYAQADALGYRVDYTAVHTYPGPSGGSSDNLINFVNSAYTYNGKNRPVLLTEFSFVDWGKNQSWSEEDNYNCLAEFLWRAEGNANLRKYALFVFTENTEWPQPANPWQDFSPAPRSNSYDINGNLTAFGKLYAAWDSDTTVRTDKTYMIHHKGLRKRMANAATTNTAPGGRTIRTDGQIVNWTLVSTGVSNRYYVVSSIDGRRLSYNAANPNGDPALAAAGTTGVDVEWSLTPTQYGWHYIGHPNTNTRLKLVSFNTSTNVADYQMVSTATTDDSVQWRFINAPAESNWTGASGNSWTSAGSWNPGALPATGQRVAFTVSSTANLTTVLNQDFNIMGLRVANPTAAVSIGGTHNLTLGAYGIDLSSATRDLTINAPLILDAQQAWSVGSGRTLNLGGTVSGDHDITISGLGKLSLSAPNVLPNGAGNGDLIVNATLDLNGASQSINGLTGTGIVDNTAAGAVTLTLGNNNAASTACVFQNTNGALTLVKTGSGSLTLPNASTHSGGFINNGTGNVVPQNNAAFGSGPVVMNGATIYAAAADYTFTNALTLNGAILRAGGGNNRIITWNGPVTVAGTSSISADGSTTGVTVAGNIDISGATFSSVSSGVANTISGSIGGASGTLRVSSGTLNLNAANTFGGTIRSVGVTGALIIGNPLAMQNATLDMNSSDAGSVDLNNLNAVIGALTGTRNLALGSGVVSIGGNNLSTTYSGVLSGSGSLVKTGGGTLTLSAANNFTGSTTLNAGTLALGANNALPATAVIIGSGTLDASTFTDTVGTLDVSTTGATINLGNGAALAFANSSAIDWTGGALNITGNFIPGASVRFGTNAAGLTTAQLALVSAPGYNSFSLTSSGYLTAMASNPYDAWKTQITNGQDGRTQDADGDGFNNLQEFLFGTSPVAANGSLVSTTPGSGTLILRWLQREAAATYTLKQSSSLTAGSWTTVVSPLPAQDANQSGAPASYDFYTVTLPTSAGTLFFRIEGVEN